MDFSGIETSVADRKAIQRALLLQRQRRPPMSSQSRKEKKENRPV